MPISRVFISPDEVYPGRLVAYDEVVAAAARLNRSEALHFLGYLNLLLSSATTETELTGRIEPVHEVQTYVFREVVSEQLLADLKAKFGNASLLDRPILHRSQTLFAIRVVATHGGPNGGNMLTTRRDFDAIGDLLFLTNGLFHAGAPASEASKALWLATHMGPLHETENPPDVELSWPRIEELLTVRLPAAADDPAELERLQQVAVFATGFSIRDWVDLTWMLFSYWAAVDFKELMKEKGRGYLDPAKPHEIISEPILRRALHGASIAFADLPARLRIEQFSPSTLFDLTPFRSRPLWAMPDGLFLCIDNAFLMERMGSHVFWSVMNALDTPERRKQFSSTWGNAFEDYCLQRIGRIFAGKQWWYAQNLKNPNNNEEISDAIAVRKTTAVLIECKGTFITSSDKYSGRPARFFRGLSRKFGRVRHGGVYQLIRAIKDIWASPAVGDALPTSGTIEDVFPVLVLLDPITHCGPVARVLSDRFNAALDALTTRSANRIPHVWPLTVVAPDDLDRLAFAVAAGSRPLPDILKRFHRLHPSRMFPLGEFLTSKEAADFAPPDQLKRMINDRFKDSTAGTLERFQNAEYGPHGARNV